MTPGIHQCNVGAVIQLIAAVSRRNLFERRIETPGQTQHVNEIPGHPEKCRVKIGHILGQHLGCIPGRVHGDHNNPGIGGFRAFQFLHQSREEGHGGRANIGTVGEAEEQQGPVPRQSGPVEAVTPVIQQLKITQLPWGIKDIEAIDLHFGRAHDPGHLYPIYEADKDYCNQQQHAQHGQPDSIFFRQWHEKTPSEYGATTTRPTASGQPA